MKNKKFNTNDLFFDNRFLMVFSAVVAVAIWLVVAVEYSPEVTVTLRQVPVTVDYSSIEKSFGLKPFGETKFTVDVTVKGKKIDVESDDIIDDISVTANTNYINSVGSYKLHLNCESVSAGSDYEIVSLSDENVNIYFDYVKEKEFVAEPEIDIKGGAVPDGYIADDVVFPESDVVKVTGPESEINKIKSITAYVQLDKQLRQNTTLEAVLHANTVDGSTLKFTTFNKPDDIIHITVPVYKKVSLPVSCSFINKPSDYVEAVPFNVAVAPASAVFGVPENKTEGMTSFEIASVDFSKIGVGTTKFTVSADDITGGIVADETKEFVITVNNSEMAEKTFEIPENVGIVNGSDGLDVTVSDFNFTGIKVVGPKDKIEQLKQEDIVLNVDMRTVSEEPGEYTVPVIFANSSCWLYGEYTARVIIE